MRLRKCQVERQVSSCGSWNTLEEDVPLPTQAVGNSRRKPVDLSDKIQELEEVDTTADVRYHTGVGELDRVLGGGLVRGSIVLLGGEPGIGKSTLLLQICQYFGKEHTVLYVSGEESAKQIELRAERLGVTTKNLFLLTVTDAQSICDTISASRPDIVIIDSIQTMRMEEISSSAGSLTQVRECTNLFMHTAKQLTFRCDRGACQQGRSHCRSEGHGTYCGHRAVFRGRTEPVLPAAACCEKPVWFYQ